MNNELTREQKASVFAFELGVMVVRILLTQQQLGHSSALCTARAYLHPKDTWTDAQQVAYEVACGQTNLSAVILARNGWTVADLHPKDEEA